MTAEPQPGGNWVTWTDRTGVVPMPITGTHRAICPDLLTIRDLGEADGWRGHLVRGVFRVLRVVTGL